VHRRAILLAALLGIDVAAAAAQTASTTPGAIPSMEETRQAMRSDDPDVRRAAIVRYLRAVEAASKGGTPQQRENVARSLVQPMEPELLRAAADSEPGSNVAAAMLLRFVPATPKVVAALSRLATARYREVRYAALGSLALIGRESAPAHAFARELVRSPDPVRFEAGAYLAGRWDMVDAVPDLARGLEQRNLNMIRDAAVALGRLGPVAEPAVGPLRASLLTIDAMKAPPTRAATAEEYREWPLPVDGAEARQAVYDAIKSIEPLFTPRPGGSRPPPPIVPDLEDQ
jgi:hypothetical protein